MLPYDNSTTLFSNCLKCLWKNVWLFVHAIMMADSPTTGGYPKIRTVVSADLALLAQCVPNKSKMRFRETTVPKAQKKYLVLMSGLSKSILEEE